MYRQQISRNTYPSFKRISVSSNQAPTQSYEPLSLVVQRAQQEPEKLSLKERQQLETVIGTRATREILAGEQTSWIPEFNGISAQLGEPIQAKLTVGQPDDKYEQEADLVAEQIMRMPESEVMTQAQSTTPLAIQRLNQNSDEKLHRQPEEDLEEQFRIEEEEEEKTVQAKEQPGQTPQVTPSFEARLNASRGQGEPLPEKTRGFMESRFGQDFSSVRVHTGSEAAQLNRELKAQAFTHKQDVYFGAGKYSPESSEGKRLLAHELTHVVQQSGNAKAALSKKSGLIMRQQVRSFFDLPNKKRITNKIIEIARELRTLLSVKPRPTLRHERKIVVLLSKLTKRELTLLERTALLNPPQAADGVSRHCSDSNAELLKMD